MAYFDAVLAELGVSHSFSKDGQNSPVTSSPVIEKLLSRAASKNSSESFEDPGVKGTVEIEMKRVPSRIGVSNSSAQREGKKKCPTCVLL